MTGRLILADAPGKPAPIAVVNACDICRAELGTVTCQRGNYSAVWIAEVTDGENVALYLLAPHINDGLPYSFHVIGIYNAVDRDRLVVIHRHLAG